MAQHTEQLLRGIPTSEGIVIGKAYVFGSIAADDGFKIPEYAIPDARIENEVQRFQNALRNTREEFKKAQRDLANRAGLHQAQIFDAHLLLLEDKLFVDQVIQRVRAEHRNVEAVFSAITGKYLKAFAELPDEYLRERASDIKDVVRRVLSNLIGHRRPTLAELQEDVVVVAHDLSPSETAVMHRERVVGIVTEIGGPTSHTSIMARALEVPAVVGVTGVTDFVHDDDVLVVDGVEGIVVIHPTPDRIAEYEQKQEASRKRKTQLLQLRALPSVTTDKRHVALLANIEIPEEAAHAMESGAEGVGLYRTEFFFMNRQDLPTEQEQFEAYVSVARRCGEKPVVIRTMDLGGDKFVSSLKIPREMNPFMGWRAIRLCLERTDIFKTQLRAILLASAEGNVRVMFPMISTVQEVRAAKKVLEQAKDELRHERKAFNERIEVGVMIEVPSAAMIADVLAAEVDFFSIGTNDLIQYCLAIDRINEKTAQMYDPMNLAVLRMVQTVIDAAHNVKCDYVRHDKAASPVCAISSAENRKSIPVALCGEVAANPLMVYLLIGMGIDELSTAATSIPRNKELVRTVSYEKARIVANEALNMDNSVDVRLRVLEDLAAFELDWA